MIYNNSLRPSILFGLVLLLLAMTGTLIWLGALLDVDAQAFDTPGLCLLGGTLVFWVLSSLFFARVRWIRVATSVLLHGIILALGVVLFGVASEEEGLGWRVFAGALFFLGAGICTVGILALHNSAMKSDLLGQAESPEDAARRRSRNRRVLIAILGIVLLGLAYGAWRIVPLLLAEPTISVDYVTEYNRVTRPAGYDPNLNAAPHYEKFFANFSDLPETLLAERRWAEWPGDLTSEEYEALEQWVAENETAMQYLKQAVRCPYWWTEFQSEDGSLEGIQCPSHLEDQRRCTFALTTLTQYYAHRGDTERAFETLADLYTIGFHATERATLLDQLAGLGICERTCKTALSVLARTEVDGKVFDHARRVFFSRIAQVRAPRFTRGEMVFSLDGIQRVFTNDGSGDGRLIPRRLYDLTKEAEPFYPLLSYAGAVWICLRHPSRQKMIEAGQRLHETAQLLTQRPPWQVFSDKTSYEYELANVVEGNYFYGVDCPSFARMITIGWRGKATGQALVTVLAVLTYKAEKGTLPESLEALVGEGLLEGVPMDPYSEGSLVYKVTGDDFTLYSVGENFFDDGGLPGVWDEVGTDRVFWPVDEES